MNPKGLWQREDSGDHPFPASHDNLRVAPFCGAKIHKKACSATLEENLAELPGAPDTAVFCDDHKALFSKLWDPNVVCGAAVAQLLQRVVVGTAQQLQSGHDAGAQVFVYDKLYAARLR